MKIRNKGHESKTNRANIKSHISKYFIDLKKQPTNYVNPNSLHPLCNGRFAQICKAKYDLIEIEICGDRIQFCKACADDLNNRTTKAMAAPPQKHYWQSATDFTRSHLKINDASNKIKGGVKSWELHKRDPALDQTTILEAGQQRQKSAKV